MEGKAIEELKRLAALFGRYDRKFEAQKIQEIAEQFQNIDIPGDKDAFVDDESINECR